MSEHRIKQLQQFLQDDPDDPFTIYALALEYLKNDQQQAKKCFEQLLEDHPDYLPSYYHAAALYVRMGLTATAKTVYQKGIELAKAQHDAHALRELQNAYTNFLYEEE